MLVDLSVRVTKSFLKEAQSNEPLAAMGHMGTHFDVMNKTFPLEFTRRKGIVFKVVLDEQRDVFVSDIDTSYIQPGCFVMFYTGFMEKTGYGTKEYFTEHPQLSDQLIDCLLKLKVSMIGIDCAGVRRPPEHTPKDQYCADQGVFIIENLEHLEQVLDGKDMAECIVHTYPINFEHMTGLPCRVVAQL